jgi:hypothetical protein
MTKKKEVATKEQETTKQENAAKKEKGKLLDERGKFAKGHKKVGGRAAGTKNRNSNIRDRLKEQVEPFIESIAENLIKVQKEEGTAAMMALQEKFMPYFMPKYSSMSLSADQDRPISEEERLLELDGLYTKKELSINFKTMTVVNNDKLHSSDPDADEDDFDLSVFDTTEG